MLLEEVRTASLGMAIEWTAVCILLHRCGQKQWGKHSKPTQEIAFSPSSQRGFFSSLLLLIEKKLRWGLMIT